MLVADAMTTVDRLSAFMGITTPDSGTPQYAVIEGIINAVTAFCKKYTSRTFKKQSYTQEEYDTERGQYINLNHYPVSSTDPIILEKRDSQLNENQWEEIDGLYYEVDYDTGILSCLDGVYFFRTVRGYRVTYSAGYDWDNVDTFLSDTDAGDLETACWLIARDAYISRKYPANLRQEKIGDYSITLQNPGKGAGFIFDNAQALDILSNYIDDSPVGVMTPLQSI
jgi:hypothetical protein